MTQVAKKPIEVEARTIRVLGRGLRAQRGVRLTLRTLREAGGKTQAEIEKLARIDQADVSRLETRESLDDSLVSTLRRYVEALGGGLELTAVFGDKRIALVGVEEAEPSNPPLQPPAGPSKARGAKPRKNRGKVARGRG